MAMLVCMMWQAVVPAGYALALVGYSELLKNSIYTVARHIWQKAAGNDLSNMSSSWSGEVTPDILRVLYNKHVAVPLRVHTERSVQQVVLGTNRDLPTLRIFISIVSDAILSRMDGLTDDEAEWLKYLLTLYRLIACDIAGETYADCMRNARQKAAADPTGRLHSLLVGCVRAGEQLVADCELLRNPSVPEGAIGVILGMVRGLRGSMGDEAMPHPIATPVPREQGWTQHAAARAA